MPSGFWLTLHNCEVFYLLAVNYDPATTDLIFIRVNIYPGPGEGGSQLISYPVHFIRVTIYLATLSHNIGSGHYLPCNTYCLLLACIKATIHIRSLSTAMQVFRFFTIIKFRVIFFNQPGSPLTLDR
jgi:hypothetical protein